MKKYIHLVVLSVMLACMLLSLPFFDSCEELCDDVLRVHILANSDSAADQSLKLRVRDRVVGECSRYYRDCADKDEALAVTRAHLSEIEATAAEEIRDCGFSYPVKAQVAAMYFNTRCYETFTMPAGVYDALRLTIGDGKGKNWWCVMYPALCVGAACRGEMRDRLDDGEYRVVTADQFDFRFRLVELFYDLRNKK